MRNLVHSRERMEGEEEKTKTFYAMGYTQKKLDNMVKERQSLLMQDAFFASRSDGWLKLEPVVLIVSNCVELFFISNEAKTEGEWENWLKAINAERELFFVQMSMAVMSEADCETCLDRMIEKYMQTDNTALIDSVFFDGYRVASGGEMHFYDGRRWAMTELACAELRRKRLCVRYALDDATKQRVRISRRIEIARAVLALAERLGPFENHDMVTDSSWDRVYAMNDRDSDERMFLRFTPLFDQYDVGILENKEIEIISEIERLICKQERINNVLDRQSDIMEKKADVAVAIMTRSKKRARADTLTNA